MAAAAPVRQQVQLCIGKSGLAVGSLVYVRQGRRENTTFAYDESWLASAGRFNVSADLQLMPGYQPHKSASAQDSVLSGRPNIQASTAVIVRTGARLLRSTASSRLSSMASLWGTQLASGEAKLSI